jgi:hypothetical protein
VEAPVEVTFKPTKGPRVLVDPALFLTRTLSLDPVDYANFGPMRMATVEMDKDHMAYVLLPLDCPL